MLEPISPARWDFAAAAHLLNRAGFGGPPDEVRALVQLGPEAAVARLVGFASVPDPWPRPDWAPPDPDRAARLRQYREATEPERRELRQAEQRRTRGHVMAFRLDWLDRMVRTPRPLQEKLVLFWHGHFATSIQKVRDAGLMWRQIETFRTHAAGHWPTLLVAVTRDPAMLLWLDQAQSRREQPNENYAREVMELFALGEGRYTERDILETARALTGLTLDRLTQETVFRPRRHAAGPKTVLGRTADFGPDEVIRHLAEQPQSARHLAARLWEFFAAEPAPEALVAALAGKFEQGGRELRPLLRALFLAEEFYAPAVVRTQVKSPVQWLVMAVRQLERPTPQTPLVNRALRELGQELLAPPNVKGWDGGIHWINTASLTARQQFAGTLVLGPEALPALAGGERGEQLRRRLVARRERGLAAPPVDAAKLFPPDTRRDPARLLAALEERFLQARARPGLADCLCAELGSQPDDAAVLAAIHALLASTDYQLT
jgi:uncharacterized protein (DUF1800 family)